MSTEEVRIAVVAGGEDYPWLVLRGQDEDVDVSYAFISVFPDPPKFVWHDQYVIALSISNLMQFYGCIVEIEGDLPMDVDYTALHITGGSADITCDLRHPHQY